MKMTLLLAALLISSFSLARAATQTGTVKDPPKCELPKGLYKSPVGIPFVVCKDCPAGQGVAADGYCAACPSGKIPLASGKCGACPSGEGVLASGKCGHCPDKWTIDGGKCAAPPAPPLTQAQKDAKAKADAAAAKRSRCESPEVCGPRIHRSFRACVDDCMAK
jgi:hypothetical protein